MIGELRLYYRNAVTAFFKEGGNTVKTLTNTTRGYWCAALGGVTWGLSGVAGQFLLSVYDASPFWLTGVRMTCAGIVFLILSLRQTRSLGIVVRHPKELITIFIYGIFGLMLSQLSYFFSISYSNAGTATVLQTLCVVMMAVLVCLQRRRLPYTREALSVILAFIVAASLNLGSSQCSQLRRLHPLID